MFRMYGRKVEILRYQVSYTEDEKEQTAYAVTEEEANEIAARVKGTVSSLQPGDDAWMDGIEVADVPDTYGEATRVYKAGQSAYEKEKKMPSDSDRLSALESAMLSMMGVTPNV